jgi:hypothetical protein
MPGAHGGDLAAWVAEDTGLEVFSGFENPRGRRERGFDCVVAGDGEDGAAVFAVAWVSRAREGAVWKYAEVSA